MDDLQPTAGPATQRWVTQSCRLARGGAGGALSVGTLILVGWATGLGEFAALHGILMSKANVGFGLTVAGLGLFALAEPAAAAWRRAGGAAAGAILVALGGSTLAEHLLDIDLGLDQVLAEEPPGAPATVSPNRMGPPAALSFLCAGSGLVLLAARRREAVHLGVVVGVIALVPTVGKLYGIGELHTEAWLTAAAWPTLVGLLSLAVGLALAPVGSGPPPVLWRDDPGGELFRRLIGPAVAVPLGLGLLMLVGARWGLYTTAVGTGLFAVSVVVGLSAVVAWAGADLSRQASARGAAERAAEQALRDSALALEAANRQLRDADRRKDEFIAILSHELRNPLAPIRSAIHLIERVDPGSPAAARAREIANRQLRHLARLVDDLLDVTRVAHGKVHVALAEVELAEIVRRVVADHRGLFDERGLTLDVDADAAVRVLGDDVRLSQVVGNLLQNAAKFTATGGHVAVALQVEGDRAVLRVRDDGIGIPQDLLGRIFEPFVQANPTFARSEGGLGLGLAHVRGLVALHGGEVVARSAGPGRGAEFVVGLPLARGEGAGPTA